MTPMMRPQLVFDDPASQMKKSVALFAARHEERAAIACGPLYFRLYIDKT
jgi:hypothetical protein